MPKCVKELDSRKFYFELTPDEFASLLQITMHYKTNCKEMCELIFATGLSSFEIVIRNKLTAQATAQ